MSQPNYKLRDDHVATAKHMRDERIRNDAEYQTKIGTVNVARLVGNNTAIDIIPWNAGQNNSIIGAYGMKPYIELEDDQVPAWINVKDLADTKAPQATTYTKTQVDSLIAGTASSGAITTLQGRVTTAENNITSLTGSTSQNAADISTLSQSLTTNYYTKTVIDGSLNNKSDKTTVTTLQSDVSTLSGNLANNYNTKTQDTALFKPIAQIENKIENSGLQCSIQCSGPNLINLRSGGQIIANMYAPTGQATNNQFLLETPDKLAMQSGSSSFSVYGGKTPTTSGVGTINTHQLVFSGRDDATKGVQANVNIGVGTAKIDVSAGHMDLGAGQTNFASVSADSSLLLSGGTPQIDPQLQLFSSTKAATLSNTMPIQATGKMGYASSTAIDNANQFTSKTYVDTQDTLKVSKAGDTMTGLLTLSGAPTNNLHAATKAYVDAQVSGAGTGDFKKDGSVSMTGALNMGTTNKIINLATPTLNTDATTKAYVDTANALKLNLSGGTMTGAIVLPADPSSNLQAATKQYVDTQVATKQSQTQGDARYLQLSGGSLTGALTLPSNPSSNLHAATKQYVDSAVSGAGSGAGISTSGGYAIATSANDIQTKKNGSTYQTDSLAFGFLESTYSTAVNRRSHIMTDSSSVNYTHAQYMVAQGAARPLIQIADVGSLGTQCGRFSVWNKNQANSGYENETYLDFKPSQTKIESSVPISYITEPSSYSGTQLITKNALDAAVSSSGGGVQNKIVSSNGTANVMTVQCNNGQVSVAKTGIVDQLQLTGNSIVQVSGNQLSLQRGQVGLTLTDDGTTLNVGSNVPVIYSTAPTIALSTDQLVSQRIADGRYMKKSADSNLAMNNYKVTGLADASASGEAVHYGQLLAAMRLLGFRRSGSISMYIGDLPLSNNANIPGASITGDAGFGTISAVHRVTSSSANYFEIRIVHNWNTNNIRLFSELYSINTTLTQLTFQNDNGTGQFITNFSNLSTNEILFWLVYEPSLTDSVQQSNGYLIKLQEWV